MQEVLRKLEQVQEIDLQINAILAKKAEFPKRLADYESELKANTQKHDEKKNRVKTSKIDFKIVNQIYAPCSPKRVTKPDQFSQLQ